MKPRFILSSLVLAMSVASVFGQAAAPQPIVDASTEHKKFIRTAVDGGLPPLVGVQSFEVYHATHVLAADPLGKGYTYNHHVDMAIWKGRYYVAWTNGKKDEDSAPAREVFATSTDGTHWSKPAELFPEGTSTSMRMFFFHAPNGRMLTTAGIRTGPKLDEKKKGGLLVREILADHTLGPVYSIIPAPADQKALEPQPEYSTSKDAGFLEACKQLLADHTYLEQQDYGVLLGKDRMSPYSSLDPKDVDDWGRAFCFYYRKDGMLAAIGKLGYEALSPDNGKTWQALPRATTLETGDAKVWLEKMSDGRYALVHNPQPTGKVRYPLVILDSDDGVTFKDMRLISGDFSMQRYAGNMRTPGVQYTRGVSIFANDGTRGEDKAMYIAYSANKEDIWVSRIPVPLKLDETAPVDDHFDQGTSDPQIVANWNTYAPEWAPITIVDNPAGGKALQITDGAPYDFAKAERVFPENKKPTVSFTLVPEKAGDLEIELRPAFGLARPIHLALAADGHLRATSGRSAADLGTYPAGKPLAVAITADCGVSTYSVTVDGKSYPGLGFVQAAESLTRLELRTGPLRAAPARNTNQNAENDAPAANPAVFLISNVSVK
jgi:hypothetical protein